MNVLEIKLVQCIEHLSQDSYTTINKNLLERTLKTTDLNVKCWKEVLAEEQGVQSTNYYNRELWFNSW